MKIPNTEKANTRNKDASPFLEPIALKTRAAYLNLFAEAHNRIIMKKMKDVAGSMKDDLIFAEKVEKAWQEHDRGKFITKTKADFLKELKAC